MSLTKFKSYMRVTLLQDVKQICDCRSVSIMHRVIIVRSQYAKRTHRNFIKTTSVYITDIYLFQTSVVGRFNPCHYYA